MIYLDKVISLQIRKCQKKIQTMYNSFFLWRILIIVRSAVVAADEPRNLTSVKLMNSPFSIINSQDRVRLSWDAPKQKGISMVEANFKWFFDELQIFVSESSFESILFKSKIGIYKSKLSELSRQARDSAFGDTPVARQSLFCTRAFFLIAHAAHMIEHHDSLATEASSLLTNMVDLHIRLLTSHDSYGNLNPNLMWPLDSIEDFQQELNSWRDDFSRLFNVPLEIRMLFTDRVKKAQRIMDILSEKASKNRKPT